MAGIEDPLLCFTNCHLLHHGEALPADLYFSSVTGLITPNYYFRTDNVTRIDLGGLCVSPGFLDLQTNGMGGVHFSRIGEGGGEADEEHLSRVAVMEVRRGVTGWWATVPTVERSRWREILPKLRPRGFEGGADLLGAHVEGPYLCREKKGAHCEEWFVRPDEKEGDVGMVYGSENLRDEKAAEVAEVGEYAEQAGRKGGTVKMITLAPELPGAIAMIGQIREEYQDVRVSLGHSNANYEEGLAGLAMGATMLTHTYNAMAPMKHREPGLAGLIASGKCWYSIIPDGIHLHPSVCSLALRTDPSKCILITDSIELAGLEDGVHAPNGQIRHRQRKAGNKVTLEGTDTLIGSCCGVDEIVTNMIAFSGCTLAESARCVTENIAEMMGERKRGVLEPGRRADFVVLTAEGEVRETWMGGRRVWKSDRDGG